MTGRHVWRQLPTVVKVSAGPRRNAFPQVQDDRLSRGNQLERVARGHPAIGIAVVLAPREERAVRLEIVDRVLHALVDLDLVRDRIGSDVDETAGLVVLRPGDGGAVKVEDQGGVAVQPFQRAFRQPMADAVVMKGVERPVVLAQIETPHDIANERGRQRGRVGGSVRHEHRRRSRVRFDVVRIEAKPLEAEEVLDRDEDDAGDGHLAHRPENHDLRLRCDVHALYPSVAGCASSATWSRRFTFPVCMSWSCR